MSQLKRSNYIKFISFEEIERATNKFADCIGRGGYGNVYKGELRISSDSQISIPVAIKRLDEKYGQGLKEFLTEIDSLAGRKHPNLINLVGYCDEEDEKILVYEYAERGSLDNYLKCSNSTTLTWSERLKICVGAATGLDYLHNHVGKNQIIIHRDVKSANILIDGNWVAKVSDLGLSKLSLAGLDRSHVVSTPCGTYGYVEPEYLSTGVVKKESDVYSFGMVLFEVICGRLCTVKDKDGMNLLTSVMAKRHYKNNTLDEIVDPRLKEEMNLESMNKFAQVAYRCLYDDREQRPLMGHVVKDLEESLKLQISHESSSSGESQGSSSKSYLRKESQSSSSNHSKMKFQRESRSKEVLINHQQFDLNTDNVHNREVVVNPIVAINPDVRYEEEEYFTSKEVLINHQHLALNTNNDLNREELVDPIVAINPNVRYEEEEYFTSVEMLINQQQFELNTEGGFDRDQEFVATDIDIQYKEEEDFDPIDGFLHLFEDGVLDMDLALPEVRNLVGMHMWLIMFLLALVLYLHGAHSLMRKKLLAFCQSSENLSTVLQPEDPFCKQEICKIFSKNVQEVSDTIQHLLGFLAVVALIQGVITWMVFNRPS